MNPILLALGPIVWFFGFSLLAVLIPGLLTGSVRVYAIRGPVLVVRASKMLRKITQAFTGFTPRCFTWQCVMFTWEDLQDTKPGPWGAYDRATVRHELTHTKQALLFGLAWPLVYLGASAVAALQGKHWYRANYFELQAKRAEVEL